MSQPTNRLVVTCVALGVVACLCAGVAFGQSVQVGKITGSIKAPTGEPLQAAPVVVSSEALLAGERSVTSSGEGGFVILNLPPGEYELTVAVPGFKTFSQTGIVLLAGAVVTLDVQMELGAVAEVLTVTSAPILDVKNTTIVTNFTDEVLEEVPTARDAFYDLSLTAPGMAPVGAAGAEGWLNSPSAYGGATSENLFLLDGVNATAPRGSSYGAQVNVNYNTVEEVRVLAPGSKAEYGSFSGAAIDVLTKSGGPRFHGDFAYYAQLHSGTNQPSGTDNFGQDWLFSEEGDELVTRPDSSDEWNLTGGGPIVKDRLWFFAGFARTNTDTEQPLWPLLLGYESDIFDLKLTAEPARGHLAWFAYHREDTFNGNGTWANFWDPTMRYDVDGTNDTFSFQWQWLPTDRTILSAKFLGFETEGVPWILTTPSNPGYVNWWKWYLFGVGGAFPYIEGEESKRRTIQADVSYYAEDFLGDHDMKFGIQYSTGEGNSTGGYFHNYGVWAYPEPWTQNVQYLQDWYGDTGLRIYVNRTDINPFETVREVDSTGIFFDDQWLVNERLTLNVGLRYDDVTADYGQGTVYQKLDSPGDINNPTVLRSRQGGDVFDFQNFSPRLGASYALTRDAKTVLKGSIGRYYTPLSLENLRRFGPDMPLAQQSTAHYSVPWAISDSDGDGFIDEDNLTDSVRALPGLEPIWVDDLGLQDTSWSLQVADGTKNPYTDQFTFGVAHELAPAYALEATYIYKTTDDLLVLWPINRQTQQEWQWDQVPYTAANGETYGVYSIAWLDYNEDGVTDVEDARWVMDNHDFEARNLGSFEGKSGDRVYQGLQLVFNKRYSNRWAMMASFLYSDSNGVAPRTVDQAWYIDGPMVHDTPFVNSPNQLVNNMEGQLPMLPEYSLKVSGTYTIPKIETNFGFRLRFNKGRPSWPVEVVPQFAEWMGSFDPGSMILSTGGETGGAIVATDPNSPDHLPDATILDLSLNRDFRLGWKDTFINVSLDALNVTNENAVNDAEWRQGGYGRVFSLERPRIYRLGVRFGF